MSRECSQVAPDRDVNADGRGSTPGLPNRPVETDAVEVFLGALVNDPAALVIEGEPGIGKTTVWLEAIDEARRRGFHVLSTRTAAVESGLAYAALADLLRGVGAATIDGLPAPQRAAVDNVMFRGEVEVAVADQRAVSAAFLAIVESLRETCPVVIAIDDMQWLDASTRQVVAFAGRRLSPGVGMLCTARTGSDDETQKTSWLDLPKPTAVNHIELQPFSLGALHAVLTRRTGRSFPRPTMARIHDLSGGNPFYAIELARVVDARAPVGEVTLPRTLAELMRARTGHLDGGLQQALLALACLQSATTDQLLEATDLGADALVALLGDAEAKGIVEITGSRVEFAHPLLARAVYDAAAPAQRRAMHRRLAQVVDQPELRARQLALGTTREDPATLRALDAAAESARARGAPAAAAELLELAMRLGGDTPERRVRAAEFHLTAGDTERARVLLEHAIAQMQPGVARAEAVQALALVRSNNDNWAEAANLLTRGLDDAVDNPELHVGMLVMLSYARLNAGDLGAAISIIDQALAEASALGAPHLLSLVQGMRVTLRFMRGDGFDEIAMTQALAAENRQADLPLPLRPHVQQAMLLGLVGQLDRAHDEMLAIRRRCLERGSETELLFVSFHEVLQAVWRGDMTEAALVTEDTVERARQLGGDFPAFIGLSLRATVAAYAGDERDARRDIDEALAAGQRSSALTLMGWTVGILGFLEVSLGNWAAALAAMEPLLAMFDMQPDATEIIPSSSLPDAVEALIQVGHLDRAEQLLDVAERNGRRLDRPWILAVSARGRAALLAATGDLDAAIAAAQTALTQHARVPMPFEQARTQLLLGQLLRRQRRREAATAMLRAALATFEDLGATLWAQRARASLERAEVKSAQTGVLTASEQRVAELAASGMTNRDIAIELFISVKTVEVNLTRVYRKLGIHSRAELGRRVDELNI